MEYKSPLQDEYNLEPGYNNDPLHPSTLGGGRYAPYPTRRYTSPQGPGPHSSRSSSIQHKYTDRYKPPEYPKELTDMFGANECKLCAVELKSPIVAKMHYGGQPHQKKIKSFLINWSVKTGCPIPVNNSVNNNSENVFPEYCDLCNVHTKSANEQILHYCGKLHKKNMLDPANAKKKKKMCVTVDLSGRFGIGIDFSSNNSENKNTIKVVEYKKPFTCELCDVTADRQEQLDQHLSGKKHKEKLEKKNLKKENKDDPWKCTVCNLSFESNYLYNLHINGKRHAKNSAKTKMDGNDYCEVCDVAFTSLQNYKDHMAGKKHAKQCNLKALDQKSIVKCQFCPFVGNMENHDCDKLLTSIDFENHEAKLVCIDCHNMVFENETKYNEHKSSSRHILCVLNHEEGDPINQEFEHLYCILCKNQFHDIKEYTDHLFHEKHMRLSQGKADVVINPQLFHCSVCNLTLTEQLKDQHLRDRQHLREDWKKYAITTLSDLANTDTVFMSYRCDDCNVGPLNFTQYSQHLLGDGHTNVMINDKLSNMKHS